MNGSRTSRFSAAASGIGLAVVVVLGAAAPATIASRN